MFNLHPSLFPLLRAQPWYPGQMGVAGSDVPRGLSTVPNRNVFFVDRGHPDASDANDGTDPDHPKSTIQSAVDSPWLSHGDFIIVGPSTLNSTYAGISTYNQRENVVVANTRPAFVHLLGGGASPFQIVWDALNTALPNLSLKAPGWTISGFKFHSPASSAAIKLFDTSPTLLDMTQYTIILNNYFDGAWSGKYGIEFTGCPGNTVIKGNWFLEHKQGGGNAYAIFMSGAGNAVPYESILEDNIFMENNNHVAVAYGHSIIQRNKFFIGGLIPATIKLDLRGGGGTGNNIVTENFMPGDYSNVGGYWDSAPASQWVGNFADDVAEAEVGDNGLTILPPT